MLEKRELSGQVPPQGGSGSQFKFNLRSGPTDPSFCNVTKGLIWWFYVVSPSYLGNGLFFSRKSMGVQVVIFVIISICTVPSISLELRNRRTKTVLGSYNVVAADFRYGKLGSLRDENVNKLHRWNNPGCTWNYRKFQHRSLDAGRAS